MTWRSPKLGAKGYCRNCGFAIVVVNIPKPHGLAGTRWQPTWVHPRATQGWDQHCFWSAQPKRHRKPVERTLHEQIVDGHMRIRELEQKIRTLQDINRIYDIDAPGIVSGLVPTTSGSTPADGEPKGNA